MDDAQTDLDGTRSSASGAGRLTADDEVLGGDPAAGDMNLPLEEGAPVDAPDPRELGGGVVPNRDTHVSAMAGAEIAAMDRTHRQDLDAPGNFGIGTTATDHLPIAQVREGMKVVDAAGDEIGKVRFVKMGDPEAVAVDPADAEHRGGILEETADVLAGRDDDLEPTLAGELLRVGYLRVDTKGWFHKDRFVPADAITNVAGDRVYLAVAKDELPEA
jgi:hypothetical protein